jgi:hypothetical protein
VSAGIEHETATSELGLLPPRILCACVPALPDEAVDVENGAENAGTQHGNGRAHLRRQTSLKGHHQMFARAITRSDQAVSLGRIHHHRLFQQHIQPCLQASLCLIVVQSMRRDDESCI